MQERKVNLFIIGAMKAGTTSFAAVLGSHAEIFMCPIKEPHYFVDPLPKQFLETSRFFSLEDYFENQFPAPLHSAQILKEEHYQQLFSKASTEKYRAEASTAYLHAPEAAKRIHNYNPKAKIIILTRDPLKRAYSHYNMDLGLGRERKSFAALMARDIDLYNTGKLPWFSYLNMSCFNKPINNYKNIFESVLVLSLEDLVENTQREMDKVSNFLNIPPFVAPTMKKLNEGRTFKNQKIIYFLKVMGLKDLFRRFFGSKLKGEALNRLSSKNKPTLTLSQNTINELENIFQDN